jgi:hypothetical protein
LKCPDRHAVERGINALKHKRPVANRPVATSPDKPAIRFTATVRIPTELPWLKRLS